MEKKDENKIIYKQWSQLLIVIIVLCVLAFSIWAIVKSVSKGETQGKELYNYSYNSKMDYKVYLKQNEFFTSPYLGMNKQYITSLIDHIEVDTKYDFRASEDLDYTYSYEMIATAKGVYSESDGKANEIWSKSYQLSPSETKNGSGKNFSVSKNILIDYSKYNQVMTDFRNSFGLSVDSRVDVVFKINVTGGLKGAENTLQESSTMTLQIPLLSPTIQIKPDYTANGNQVIYDKSANTEQGIDVMLLAIGVVLLLLSLFILKIYISKLIVTTQKSEYIIKLNKIYKEYADIIAEAKNLPDLTKYDVVSIKQFNDLVDIEEELHSPIISCEIREDLETWFMVLYNQTAYRYILKYEDFGKIIKK